MKKQILAYLAAAFVVALGILAPPAALAADTPAVQAQMTTHSNPPALGIEAKAAATVALPAASPQARARGAYVMYSSLDPSPSGGCHGLMVGKKGGGKKKCVDTVRYRT